MSKKFWSYSTEFEQVEEVGLLFLTLEEAKEHALHSYIIQGMDEEDWRQLTSYYKFKVLE